MKKKTDDEYLLIETYRFFFNLQMKEYTDLEVVLRNSLNEVEKREKQLALNETQVSEYNSIDYCIIYLLFFYKNCFYLR